MPNNTQNKNIRQQIFRRKNPDLFRKVIELRKNEYSYTNIKKETGLAKSTIQNWLTYAGLTLTKEHLEIRNRNSIAGHVAATAASKITRSKRKSQKIQLFIQSVKKYFVDPFFIAGIMLYEAEGSKGSANGFSNSDFRLIRVFIKFLEKYLMLDRNKNMTFRLYIHDTRKNDLSRIVNFWAKKLLIDPNHIKLSWKHNIVVKKRINLDYVGQFEVRVRGLSNFTGKLLAVSDIILSQYQK